MKAFHDYAPFERVRQEIKITDDDGEQITIDAIACVDDCDDGEPPIYSGPREDWCDGVPGSVEYTVFYDDGEPMPDHLADQVNQAIVFDVYVKQRAEAERP